MDPNDGGPEDAILVYCDKNTKSTCILPKPEVTPEISVHDKQEEINWLSEMSNGMKITYKAERTQIKSLQDLSESATQNITYHCRKTVAYYDVSRRTYKKGITFWADNDAEITPRGKNSLSRLQGGLKERNPM